MDTLVIGTFSAEKTEEIRSACKRAKCAPVMVSHTDEAKRTLSSGSPPRAIFVDGCLGGVQELVGWVRGQAHLFTVPIVVLVPSAAENSYLEAHGFGADDAVVDTDYRGISARLTNLADFDPARRPEINQGQAIIAFREERGRRVLGRILRQAGFDVSFALHGEELADRATKDSLLVVEANLPAGRANAKGGALDALRAKGAPTIVLGSRAELRLLRPEAQGLNCALGNILAPPDHLLFLANELLRPDTANVRASTRVLYGALASFRAAGSLSHDYGLTYNLSREGLYVRTLTPPERGSTLWVEMRAPGGREAIHLRGEVVWATGPHRPGGTAPPGFGLRIVENECPPADIAVYREGYRCLVHEQILLRAAA